MNEYINDYIDYLRYVSYIINFSVLAAWFRRKVILNRFLTGRWEGTLLCKDDENIVFDCVALITEHNDQDDKAILYYKRKRLDGSTVAACGLDRLISYDNDIFFCFRKKWTPTFVREFHYDPNSPEPTAKAFMPKQYQWSATITSLWFNPKMKISIAASDVAFSGTLSKC